MLGDPIDLILKLQQKYKEFGAVKIRACPEWNPPFNFKYTEKGITTRIQKIHRLKQGRVSIKYRQTSFGLPFYYSIDYNLGIRRKKIGV
jgi:hypothetical protein